MLCKVKDDAPIDIAGTPILLANSTSTNLSQGDHRVYNNNFSWEQGAYKVYLTGSTNAYNTGLTYKLAIGDNSIDKWFTTPVSQWANYDLYNTISKSTNWVETLKVWIYSPRSLSSETFNVSNLYIQQTQKTIPGTTGVTGKPRSLKAISQKATITIFWLHIDRTRITQDV